VIQLVFAIVLFTGTQQGQVAIVSADTQELDEHIGHAIGNVIVTDQDMRVEADEATYDQDAPILTAGNHVKYTRTGEKLEAQRGAEFGRPATTLTRSV
jgi:lipopolysaccharide assembly outer membrane protein LptD (OstA)